MAHANLYLRLPRAGIIVAIARPHMGPEVAPPKNAPHHAGLEAALVRAIDALRGGADGRAAELWGEFRADLASHLDWEEQVLVAPMLVARPREANVIMEEHRHLRRRMTQIDGQLARITAGLLTTFLDELRAHGRHEERELYRWARATGLGDI